MKVKLLPLQVGLILGTVFPVFAEELSKADEESAIETITVTATKRETSLMSTPVALTVFSAEQLEKQGLTNVKDLGGHVPNLSIGTEAAHNAPVISMRGIRSTNSTTIGDPAVGLHLDGIYQPRPQSATALMFDVERVEVLRGPQGTLFGRNSTVGTINILSKRPELDEFSGSIGVELGSWNNQQVKGVVNIPISDTFAIRGSFFNQTRDSYLDGYYDANQFDVRQLGGNDFIANATPDTGDLNGHQVPWWRQGGAANVSSEPIKADPSSFYNNKDQHAFRLSALWQPSDNFNWLVSFDQYQDQSAGNAFQLSCDDAAKRNVEAGDPGRTCEKHFGTSDKSKVYVGTPGNSDVTINSLRSNVTWDFSDNYRLVHNFGMTQLDRDSLFDFDQGTDPWDQQMAFDDLEMDSFSHELQIQSMDDSAFQWIAGLYFFEEENNGHGYWEQSLSQVEFWDIADEMSTSKAIFTQGSYEFNEKLTLTLGVRHSWDERSTGGGNYVCNRSDADGNGDACFPKRPPNSAARTELNGLSDDYFFSQFDIDQANGFTSPDGYQLLAERNNSGEWDDTTWRVGLDYAISDDTLVYGYVANGYKAGGYTSGVNDFDGNPVDTNYDPEQVITYELGMKSTMLDNSLNLSLAYFYSDYQDQQFSRPVTVDERTVDADGDGVPDIDPDTGVVIVETLTPLLTSNLDKSVIQGLEAEFDWVPWDNGRISGFATWMDSEVTSETTTKWNHLLSYTFGHLPSSERGDHTNPELQVNLEGNELPFTPTYAFTVKIEHDFAMPFGGVLTPFVSMHWEDESYLQIWNVDKHLDDMNFDPRINPLSVTDKRDAWKKIDATLRYTSDSENWFVEAFVNNATDESTIKYQKGNQSFTRGMYELPRHYGVRFNYIFD